MKKWFAAKVDYLYKKSFFSIYLLQFIIFGLIGLFNCVPLGFLISYLLYFCSFLLILDSVFGFLKKYRDKKILKKGSVSFGVILNSISLSFIYFILSVIFLYFIDNSYIFHYLIRVLFRIDSFIMRFVISHFLILQVLISLMLVPIARVLNCNNKSSEKDLKLSLIIILVLQCLFIFVTQSYSLFFSIIYSVLGIYPPIVYSLVKAKPNKRKNNNGFPFKELIVLSLVLLVFSFILRIFFANSVYFF